MKRPQQKHSEVEGLAGRGGGGVHVSLPVRMDGNSPFVSASYKMVRKIYAVKECN